MARRTGVQPGMRARRGVTAADVPAGHAQAQMHPRRTCPETLLATLLRPGNDATDQRYVWAARRPRAEPSGHVCGSPADRGTAVHAERRAARSTDWVLAISGAGGRPLPQGHKPTCRRVDPAYRGHWIPTRRAR